MLIIGGTLLFIFSLNLCTQFYYENIVQRIYDENHKEHQGKLNMENFHALDMETLLYLLVY